jgi:hypothetical protein
MCHDVPFAKWSRTLVSSEDETFNFERRRLGPDPPAMLQMEPLVVPPRGQAQYDEYTGVAAYVHVDPLSVPPLGQPSVATYVHVHMPYHGAL